MSITLFLEDPISWFFYDFMAHLRYIYFAKFSYFWGDLYHTGSHKKTRVLFWGEPAKVLSFKSNKTSQLGSWFQKVKPFHIFGVFQIFYSRANNVTISEALVQCLMPRRPGTNTSLWMVNASIVRSYWFIASQVVWTLGPQGPENIWNRFVFIAPRVRVTTSRKRPTQNSKVL